MENIVSYFCAICIGLSLGLFGSGGSILTLPVLVYIVCMDSVVATGYSLFIVGTTSLAGALNYMRKQLIDYKTAFFFALPSLITVYLFRRFAMPLIPDVVFSSANFVLYKSSFIMLVFAVLMLVAAVSMIRSNNKPSENEKTFNYPFIFLLGIIVGCITGFVSVGGGFLIIPALVLFAGVPIRMAVGTSLIIIASNSFTGFAGELYHVSNIDWKFLFQFCAFSVIGILLGGKLSQMISAAKLKVFFGWFILAMAVFIFISEIKKG